MNPPIERKDARVVVLEVVVANVEIANRLVAELKSDWDCWEGYRSPDGIIATEQPRVWEQPPNDDQLGVFEFLHPGRVTE